jgi:Ca2+/Na+ antiporter
MVIAFVLALPLLLVLPVGLSSVGKMVVLLIAMLLSFLSFIAKPFFSMWQLVLLVGLLMIAVTYLLHRQFAHVFYKEKQVDDDEELEAQDEQAGKTFGAVSKNIDVLREREAIADETQLEEIADNVSQKSLTADEEEEIIMVDELPFEAAADVERIEATWENDEEKQKETPALDELLSEVAVEEKQPEHGSEGEMVWETMEIADPHEEESVEPLLPAAAPYAELLDELPVAVTPELEEQMTVIPAATQEAEADGEEKLSNLHTWDVLTDHLSLNENGLEAEEESGVEWEEIIPEEIEVREADLREAVWRETIEEGTEIADGYQLAEQEHDVGEKEQSVVEQETDKKAPKNGSLISQVRSEVIRTVADELRLNRKHMDPLQYEQYLTQCLQAPLPDENYYVFARLLMEHYVIEKQYDRLATWLVQLEEKFRSYPIIQAEIQFLQQLVEKLQNGCGEKHEK